MKTTSRLRAHAGVKAFKRPSPTARSAPASGSLQSQRRDFSATPAPASTQLLGQQGSSRKGKERSRPLVDNDLRSLAYTSPTGIRSLSSSLGPGPARLGMDSEADLGRHFYLNKVLEQWAAKPATRMTLRQLIFFGRTLGRDREKILKSANYVRQELPVRIAHRIRDLQALPFVVMTNQHLEDVYQKYWSAFETFRRFPHIKSMDDNEKFCNLLRGLLDDHLTIIPSLTIGIVESSHICSRSSWTSSWSVCCGLGSPEGCWQNNTLHYPKPWTIPSLLQRARSTTRGRRGRAR